MNAPYKSTRIKDLEPGMYVSYCGVVIEVITKPRLVRKPDRYVVKTTGVVIEGFAKSLVDVVPEGSAPLLPRAM